MKKKILLTYAMYGSGHKAIADYIANYFKSQNTDIEIKNIDLLQYSTPILGNISQKISTFFMLKFPIGWTAFYKMFDSKLASAFMNNTSIKLFNNKKIKKEIIDFNPDLTISTHFFGSSLIDYYNRRHLINSKLITVITDYEAHSIWLRGYKTEQAIIVGDKDEEKSLIKKGVSKDIIKPIGIPINPQIGPDFDITKAIAKNNFSGLRPICVFFGGGGNGGTSSLPYLKRIIKNKINIDIVYIAGRNQKAKNKVDQWIKMYNVKNIKTYGYVNNVPELLQICDFVVSKPGGAQSTEALYFKKPLLMINCSGGQEKANIRYFEKNKYGKYFHHSYSFYRYVKKISDNPQIISKMRDQMKLNPNDKAMPKLYKIAMDILKS